MSSNTVIGTNTLALTAHRNLTSVGRTQSKASKRLSSGLKINSAADDAAGLGISQKMKAQIRGLDMAEKNADDAISLIQTAEGSVSEMQSMLQRARELSVQSANDTNTTEERVKMASEMVELIDEIDSMGARTEFNGQKLVDGTFSGNFQVGANSYQTISINLSEVSSKTLGNIYTTAVQKEFDLFGGTFDELKGSDIVTNLSTIAEKTEKIATQIKNSLDANGVPTSDVKYDNSLNTFFVKINEINTKLTAILDDESIGISAKKLITEFKDKFSNLVDDLHSVAKAAFKDLTVANPGPEQFTSPNQPLTDKQKAAFESLKSISKNLKGYTLESDSLLQGIHKTVIAQVSSLDHMKAQLTEFINGGTELNHYSFTTYLESFDVAISQVSAVRAKLGATQNRLGHTISNLQVSSENLSSANSRIEDADMAKEMMDLTKANVLQQAAISILAQANQAPNNITQLLG